MKSGSSNTAATAAHILLVDDNRLGLAARKALLEEEGYHVTTASDGEQALAKFQENSFALVVTDYKMPKKDGIELIRAIRSVSAAMPIILISGYTEALGLTEESTGADLVIAKSSYEVQHLLRSVHRLLRHPVRKPPRSQRNGGTPVRQAR